MSWVPPDVVRRNTSREPAIRGADTIVPIEEGSVLPVDEPAGKRTTDSLDLPPTVATTLPSVPTSMFE
jgi:hypothetical protein